MFVHDALKKSHSAPSVKNVFSGCLNSLIVCVRVLESTTDYCSCSMDSQLSSNLSRYSDAMEDFLNTTDWEIDDDTSRTLRHVKYALCGTTIAVNLSSVLAIAASYHPMAANVRLLCSLALSDLLCGVLAFLDDAGTASIITCRRQLFKSMMAGVHLNALFSILGIAIDHFLAVCRPLYHRSDNNILRVNVLIGLIWIISSTPGSSPLHLDHFLYTWIISGMIAVCDFVGVVTFIHLYQ